MYYFGQNTRQTPEVLKKLNPWLVMGILGVVTFAAFVAHMNK